MAIYFRDLGGLELQASEATTVKRTVYFEVGTAEAQAVQVSKAGAAFGAAVGTATAVTGTMYKLNIAAGDLDTEGEVAFYAAGATDQQFITGLRVVDHDPFDALNEVNRALVGKVVTDTDANTIKIYAADGATLLVTQTKTTAGTAATWTPT